MLFNSFNFLVFYIVVFSVSWALRKRDAFRILFLLAGSLFFYMSWNWKYLGLILFTTFLNFFTGIGIDSTDNPKMKKAWLIAGVAGSLAVLAVFKYYNFFVHNLTETLSVFGVNPGIGTLEILLPVGISFYTFHCLSYTIDIYRGEFKPTRNIFLFTLFVSFFPQLVAGPIIRGRELLPQLSKPVTYDDERTLSGLWLIFKGLFKKILIADVLAVTFVDKVFASPHQFAGPEMLLAIYGYAIQIYCDFSGYSDIAIGVAKTLGYDLPVNFNSPYLAEDIRDFWRRWHISLSTWLRDYLYISIGGSRGGKLRTLRNLMITMLLGGLWHGAAMNYVIWGGYHGILLAVSHQVDSVKKAWSIRPGGFLVKAAKVFMTFNLICFGWLMFRSPDMATFTAFLKRLVLWPDHRMQFSWMFLAALAAGFVTHFTPRGVKVWIEGIYLSSPAFFQGLSYAAALVVFTAFSAQEVPFIYFQF